MPLDDHGELFADGGAVALRIESLEIGEFAVLACALLHDLGKKVLRHALV